MATIRPANTAPAPAPAPTPTTPVTCDRCGPAVLALVHYTHPNHGRLAFCRHHALMHSEALRTQGWNQTLRPPTP